MLREHFEHGVKTSGLRGAQGPKKTIPCLAVWPLSLWTWDPRWGSKSGSR